MSASSRWILWPLVAVTLVSAAGLGVWAQYDASRGPALWRINVVAVYPHDPAAFTQGLTVHDGRLYEGTGQYGGSSLRQVDISSGRVEKIVRMSRNYFGEGITVLGGRLYQLTWQNRVGIVYDVETFQVLESFRYEGEGWGLTHDGEHLIVSDGTASIRFLDPMSFEVVRELTVRDNGQSLTRLNELEYVQGEIWANVWYDDRIARISPDDGELLGWIDLTGLHPPASRGSEDVLNGIAFDAEAGRIFVTGKNWPQLYEIEVVR